MHNKFIRNVKMLFKRDNNIIQKENLLLLIGGKTEKDRKIIGEM